MEWYIGTDSLLESPLDNRFLVTDSACIFMGLGCFKNMGQNEHHTEIGDCLKHFLNNVAKSAMKEGIKFVS